MRGVKTGVANARIFDAR